MTATPYPRAASSGGQPQCLPEEDGSVLVRDDLDALLEVRGLAACAVDAALALQRWDSVLPELTMVCFASGNQIRWQR